MLCRVLANSASALQGSKRIGLKDSALPFCVIYVLDLSSLPSSFTAGPKKVKKFISIIVLYEINPVYSLNNLLACAMCSIHRQGLSIEPLMDFCSFLFSASSISIQAIRAMLIKVLTSPVMTELSPLLSPTPQCSHPWMYPVSGFSIILNNSCTS